MQHINSWTLGPLIAAALLSACSDGSRQTASSDPSGPPLCVAEDCGVATVLATVPDAENLLFTPAGRLFVSGGTNVFEVVRTGAAAVELTALAADDCNFTGLAQRGDTLYAACGDGRLFAAALTATPALSPIHTFDGVALPNGMATGADGALYVVDGPLPANGGLPSPKIVRLRFAPDDPMAVTEQLTWLDSGLQFPNGLVRRGDALLFTDAAVLPPEAGAVRSVTIQPDGAAGPVETLAVLDGIPDDLSLVGEDILVTEYATGQVRRLAADGTRISATAVGGFAFPSSIIVGQPPMFAANELLVTEKGQIGDTASSFGNALTLFAPIAD